MIEEDTESDPEDVFSDAYNGIEKDPEEELSREYKLDRVVDDVFYFKPVEHRMSDEESQEFYERLDRFKERCRRLDEEDA